MPEADGNLSPNDFDPFSSSYLPLFVFLLPLFLEDFSTSESSSLELSFFDALLFFFFSSSFLVFDFFFGESLSSESESAAFF